MEDVPVKVTNNFAKIILVREISWMFLSQKIRFYTEEPFTHFECLDCSLIGELLTLQLGHFAEKIFH